MTAEGLIKALGLVPHREGGYFRETYRSAESIPASSLPKRYGGARDFSTAIYFLLPEGTKSLLHRVKSDELWHYHLGGPLDLTQISPSGNVSKVVIGPDVGVGQVLQHAVPAGDWFGAIPRKGSGFCLAGCTVAPGFDFADFELAKREDLLARFPYAVEDIRALTD